MICSFVIYSIGLVAHVRVRRIERIRFAPEWLEREAAGDLAALRFIASSPEISRELWVCTPKGSFRFFRVLENSLVELDRSGNPLPGQPPVPARTMPAATPARAEKSGGPASAPGSPGSAVRVPVYLLPAATPESVNPLTVTDIRQVIRPGGGEESCGLFDGENTDPESKSGKIP
jgi:hypothetical protein